MYASLFIIAYTLFLSYHSYVYALSFIIACTFLLFCLVKSHCVRDIAIFVCLKHLNAYTNFCINVNSDRFSESAFEFVLITVFESTFLHHCTYC